VTKSKTLAALLSGKDIAIASLSLLAITAHLLTGSEAPLLIALSLGGLPLLIELGIKFAKRNFDSDLLAGVSIATSIVLAEYLAGSIVVLMLAGGRSLERFATTQASSVLRALAKRMPTIAHRLSPTSSVEDVAVQNIRVNDVLVIFPHEVCPTDAVVIEGDGYMDESYLSGEPFQVRKTVGSEVLSGAVNGESPLKIRVSKVPKDSRYEKIMLVMRESEQKKPKMRRLGDQMGTYYTPLVLIVAAMAWWYSGDSLRFLSVLVVATPCPLLIAIPIAIIGAISLSAKKAILIKSPIALEQIAACRVAIFDKTGTLTNGEARITQIQTAPDFDSRELLALVASLEGYSKHPLARAIMRAAAEQKLPLQRVSDVREVAGRGLEGKVGDRRIKVTSRTKLLLENPVEGNKVPISQSGLECVIVVDDKYAGTIHFHDAPRDHSKLFIGHLKPRHEFERIMILSGDRDSEVRYLAELIGVSEVHSQKSPEQKLEIVRKETRAAKTLYVGDGINDAPAMMAATVGMAIGPNSEITSEAASVVILDSSLEKVDEFMHIGRRLRKIVLQSAGGGMFLSILAMGFAAAGQLSPVQGAITQEIIDILSILNALRMALPTRSLQDFSDAVS